MSALRGKADIVWRSPLVRRLQFGNDPGHDLRVVLKREIQVQIAESQQPSVRKLTATQRKEQQAQYKERVWREKKLLREQDRAWRERKKREA